MRKLVEMMQKADEEQEEQRGRVAPHMGGLVAHTPRPWSFPERRETSWMRWADCEDDERQEEEEREQKIEKETMQETGQEELTSETTGFRAER